MYKRQIYQIAESNRIEKNRFGSENRIESKLFRPELECSSVQTPQRSYCCWAKPTWRMRTRVRTYSVSHNIPARSATAALSSRSSCWSALASCMSVSVCRSWRLNSGHFAPSNVSFVSPPSEQHRQRYIKYFHIFTDRSLAKKVTNSVVSVRTRLPVCPLPKFRAVWPWKSSS